jgi:hypothetical protein
MTSQSRVTRVLSCILIVSSTLIATSASGFTGTVDAASANTYTCHFFHVSVVIPKGWASEPSFSSQNTICTDLQSYTSAEYRDPRNNATFVLNNEEGINAVSPRAAIAADAGNFGLVTTPSTFQSIRGNNGSILTAAVRTATSLTSTASSWYFGAVCQKHYCVTFISFTALGAPKSVSNTLRATLLSLRFLPGASTAFGSAPKARAVPTPQSQASFSVSADVSPSSMPYNAYPTLTATTSAGATCSASVVYSTGRSPVSFDGSAQIAPASGSVSWSWHEETKGSGGTATVDCTLGGRTAEAQASFIVN